MRNAQVHLFPFINHEKIITQEAKITWKKEDELTFYWSKLKHFIILSGTGSTMWPLIYYPDL